jgi:predicted metal-dependent peptidase
MLQEATKQLTKAKIALMKDRNSVFYTTVCLSLIHEFDESIPTACTNGKYIKYNPEFFLSLSKEERVFLLLHETMHVAYVHMDRLNARIHSKWNKACDYVINAQLIDAGFTMPADGLYDKQYVGMSAEEVYKLLPDDDSKYPQSDLVASDMPSDELKTSVDNILVRDITQAKMSGSIGNVPKDMLIYLDKLLNPKLPWQRILSRYMTAVAKEDYSYRRPNKRYMPDLYMPSLYSEAVEHIAVAVDASGSVTNEDFSQFIAEITKVIKTLKPTKLTLIQFDTRIISIDVLKNVQDLNKVSFKGKGGTCVNPVINWINANKPVVTVIFTDGEFYKPKNKSKSNVLWAIHNNPSFNINFGKVIHYELN